MEEIEVDLPTGKAKFREVSRKEYAMQVIKLTMKSKNYLDDLMKMELNYPRGDLPDFLACGMDTVANLEPQDDYWLDQKCNYTSYFGPVYKACTPELPKLGRYSFKTNELIKPSFVYSWFDSIFRCKHVIIQNGEALRRIYDKGFKYFIGENGLPMAVDETVLSELKKTEEKRSNNHMFI